MSGWTGRKRSEPGLNFLSIARCVQQIQKLLMSLSRCGTILTRGEHRHGSDGLCAGRVGLARPDAAYAFSIG